MKKFVKFLNKAKDVLGSKGKDIGQLAIAAATADQTVERDAKLLLGLIDRHHKVVLKEVV